MSMLNHRSFYRHPERSEGSKGSYERDITIDHALGFFAALRMTGWGCANGAGKMVMPSAVNLGRLVA